MVEFNHPLLQNNKDWYGYTVFTFKFNDVPIRFVSEKDAQHVLGKERNFAREELLKNLCSTKPSLGQDCSFYTGRNCKMCQVINSVLGEPK